MGAAPTPREACGGPSGAPRSWGGSPGWGEGSPHRRPRAAVRPPRAADPGRLLASAGGGGGPQECGGHGEHAGAGEQFWTGKGRSPSSAMGDTGTPPLAEVLTRTSFGSFPPPRTSAGECEEPERVGAPRRGWGSRPAFGELGWDPPDSLFR